MDDWTFDIEDPLLAGFHEDLLTLVHLPGVSDAVAWKLREIQRNPRMAGSVCTVDDDVVYLAKTGRYRRGVPPLLIAYLLDVRRRIIQPFLLCKAEDDVEDRIRRALRRRNGPRGH